MSKKEPKANKVTMPEQPKPKTEMYMGVKGEGDTVVHMPKGAKAKYVQVEAKQPKAEKMVNPGYVMNRRNHNVTLSYNGDAMIVAPRQRAKVADLDKLGALLSGVTMYKAV